MYATQEQKLQHFQSNKVCTSNLPATELINASRILAPYGSSSTSPGNSNTVSTHASAQPPFPDFVPPSTRRSRESGKTSQRLFVGCVSPRSVSQMREYKCDKRHKGNTDIAQCRNAARTLLRATHPPHFSFSSSSLPPHPQQPSHHPLQATPQPSSSSPPQSATPPSPSRLAPAPPTPFPLPSSAARTPRPPPPCV